MHAAKDKPPTKKCKHTGLAILQPCSAPRVNNTLNMSTSSAEVTEGVEHAHKDFQAKSGYTATPSVGVGGEAGDGAGETASVTSGVMENDGGSEHVHAHAGSGSRRERKNRDHNAQLALTSVGRSSSGTDAEPPLSMYAAKLAATKLTCPDVGDLQDVRTALANTTFLADVNKAIASFLGRRDDNYRLQLTTHNVERLYYGFPHTATVISLVKQPYATYGAGDAYIGRLGGDMCAPVVTEYNALDKRELAVFAVFFGLFVQSSGRVSARGRDNDGRSGVFATEGLVLHAAASDTAARLAALEHSIRALAGACCERSTQAIRDATTTSPRIVDRAALSSPSPAECELACNTAKVVEPAVKVAAALQHAQSADSGGAKPRRVNKLSAFAAESKQDASGALATMRDTPEASTGKTRTVAGSAARTTTGKKKRAQPTGGTEPAHARQDVAVLVSRNGTGCTYASPKLISSELVKKHERASTATTDVLPAGVTDGNLLTDGTSSKEGDKERPTACANLQSSEQGKVVTPALLPLPSAEVSVPVAIHAHAMQSAAATHTLHDKGATPCASIDLANAPRQNAAAQAGSVASGYQLATLQEQMVQAMQGGDDTLKYITIAAYSAAVSAACILGMTHARMDQSTASKCPTVTGGGECKRGEPVTRGVNVAGAEGGHDAAAGNHQ